MDSGLMRRFLELFSRTLQSERRYKIKYGIKMEDGYSMCQEITIVKITTTKLAEICIGKLEKVTEIP